jgi:hypothetical protein
MIKKWLSIGIIFLFVGTIIISSSQASSTEPRFCVTKISVVRYFANIYVPLPEQQVKVEVKNIGDSSVVNVIINVWSEIYRYSFFKKPYRAGEWGEGFFIIPEYEWKPNETRTFRFGNIYDKSFLQFFPIKYHIWGYVWTGIGWYTPEDKIIDGDFLIWGYRITPV